MEVPPVLIRAERGFFRGVSRVSAPVVVIAFSLFIVSRLLLSRLFQPVKFKVSKPLLHIRGRSCLNGVAGIHARVGPCDFVNYWWREGVFYTAVKLWDGCAFFSCFSCVSWLNNSFAIRVHSWFPYSPLLFFSCFSCISWLNNSFAIRVHSCPFVVPTLPPAFFFVLFVCFVVK